jgi:adenylate/guanylate cyclase family protein
LVVHRDNEIADLRKADYIVERIPGEHLVVLAGIAHLPWISNQDAFMDEIGEFVTGTRHSMGRDTVLATVLFTDIVDSTGLAYRLGDTAWRRLLDEHDTVVARVVAADGGRIIKSMGDGVMTVFDIPTRAILSAVHLCHDLPKIGVNIRTGHTPGRWKGEAAISEALASTSRNGYEPGGSKRGVVTNTVKELSVGSSLTFAPRGAHQLKGIEGEWHLYRATTGGMRRPLSPCGKR